MFFSIIVLVIKNRKDQLVVLNQVVGELNLNTAQSCNFVLLSCISFSRNPKLFLQTRQVKYLICSKIKWAIYIISLTLKEVVNQKRRFCWYEKMFTLLYTRVQFKYCKDAVLLILSDTSPCTIQESDHHFNNYQMVTEWLILYHNLFHGSNFAFLIFTCMYDRPPNCYQNSCQVSD